MGNCVSCAESGNASEQPQLRLTDKSDSRLSDLQPLPSGPGSISRDRGGGGAQENLSNGTRTPGGSSSQLMVGGNIGGSDGPPPLSTSQKAEKKTFYSRIPPLGRSGSTDRKSNNAVSTNNNTPIRDNNNAYSETKIVATFEHYKDPYDDAILAEGIETLCRDLDVKPEDFKVLVLAWKFGAEQMCRFSREEFIRGMRELKTDSIKGVQAKLPDIVVEVMADPAKYKDLYRFAFKFGLDAEIGQRILPVDMAVSLWRVVWSQKEPPVLERWLTFLQSHPNTIRGIPKDTWNMFLNFVETVGSDLSSYDDTEAWPSLFDDFVEFENDRVNQNTITVDQEEQPSSGTSPKNNSPHICSFRKGSPSLNNGVPTQNFRC